MPALAQLSDYPEAVRAVALARFAQIRPHLEEGVPLPTLARQQGCSVRTMERWVQAYRRSGLQGLCRQPRADRNIPRLDSRLIPVIEGLALRVPTPSTANIHRQVVALADQQGWPAPSYSSVYAVIRRIDPGLRTLALDGAKQYQETYDLLYRREASRANEMWQADHTPLDIWLLDSNGKPRRPWLTVIIDDYSRAVAGYFLSFQHPSALQTALTLRGAIWRKADAHWHVCGIPNVFYTDHGSDFESQHMEQVSADIKMQLVFSWPGQPRGRGRIERFFNTVNQMFLEIQPGYRPAGAPPITPALTLPEFEARWRTWLLDQYHGRVHSETGQTPHARWTAGGWLPRLPESLEQLDLLLLTVATSRRVQQDGIRFRGLRYLDLTLAGYVGEDVTIRYDPRDMAEIRVYYQDRFLCRAVCQEIAGQTISLKDIIAARTEQRRSVRNQLTERQQAIERLLEVHKAPPEPPTPPPDPELPRLRRYYNE